MKKTRWAYQVPKIPNSPAAGYDVGYIEKEEQGKMSSRNREYVTFTTLDGEKKTVANTDEYVFLLDQTSLKKSYYKPFKTVFAMRIKKFRFFATQ